MKATNHDDQKYTFIKISLGTLISWVYHINENIGQV